jgi:hypothetical protein
MRHWLIVNGFARFFWQLGNRSSLAVALRGVSAARPMLRKLFITILNGVILHMGAAQIQTSVAYEQFSSLDLTRR